MKVRIMGHLRGAAGRATKIPRDLGLLCIQRIHDNGSPEKMLARNFESGTGLSQQRSEAIDDHRNFAFHTDPQRNAQKSVGDIIGMDDRSADPAILRTGRRRMQRHIMEY